MSALYVTRIAIDSTNWTAIRAPQNCDFWGFVSDTAEDMNARVDVNDASTEWFIKGGFQELVTSPLSSRRVVPRWPSNGACTVAAGLKVGVWEIGNPGTATQVANAANQRLDHTWPDGIEFSGATRNICLSANVLGAAAQAVTITLIGYEY